MSEDSSNRWTSLSEMQSNEDERFARDVEERFLKPVIADIGKRVPGFDKMTAKDRFMSLLWLNDSYRGKGESLPLVCPNYESNWFPAYSGEPVTPSYEMAGIGGVLPQQPAEYACWPGRQGARYLLERPGFNDLPCAFRVAVIAEYVLENVVTGNTEAFSFAMGASGLETHRVAVAPKVTFSAPGARNRRIDGWVIHIKDACPTNEQMLEIGRFIRRFDSRTQQYADNLSDDGRAMDLINEMPDHRKNPRAGSAVTRAMVEVVDGYIASGANPMRGGTCTWKDVWSRVSTDRPDISDAYPSAEKLMQSYCQYKRRRGKSDKGASSEIGGE